MLFAAPPTRTSRSAWPRTASRWSQEAIRRYYHSQILPARLARQNKTAEELNKISVDGVDEATMRAIRSAALDLAASPVLRPQGIEHPCGAHPQGRATGPGQAPPQDTEAKAAQADAAKQVTQSTLTPEERDRKLRSIFGC